MRVRTVAFKKKEKFFNLKESQVQIINFIRRALKSVNGQCNTYSILYYQSS